MENFGNMPAMEKKEMMDTLSEVAKMKAHFDLLKNVILSKMRLDYYGKDLVMDSSSLLTEVMWLIAPEAMDEILEHEKEQLRQEKEKKEAKNNG